MKWTSKHDIKLGRETLLLELWKYKSGSREKCQCLDKIAENLNQIKELYFNVNQTSVRTDWKFCSELLKRRNDQKRTLVGYHQKRENLIPSWRNRKKILTKYLQNLMKRLKRRKHLLKPCVTWLCSVCPKLREVAKIGPFSIYEQPKYKPNLTLTLILTQILTLKPTWVDATIRSHFGCSYIEKEPEDCPKKKRKSSGNDTIHYPQDKASKDYEIQKQTLDVKQKHNEAMAKQSELLMQQQQDMMTNLQQQLASQQKESEQII